jgi:acetyl-CoA carboxylase carboxyltransferase component
MFARDRIDHLVDAGSFVEDAQLANAMATGLPADGVIIGTATVNGRPVALMANDSTVKAGSWGARTVEKIIRIITRAYDLGIPMVWLVDSAGARITDCGLFPVDGSQHLLQRGARVRPSRRCALLAERSLAVPTFRPSTWL